ncbi:MAG TPA: universal stress protein, partial [Thermoanaerobaculia bacterium]
DVVREGLKLACAAGAAVHLVHAFELPVAYTTVPYAVAPPLFAPIDESDVIRDVETELARQVERLGATGLASLRRHAVQGPAHRALLAVAREVAADLVIVGAADTLVGRILGTTASRVLRGSLCPVLLLRGRLPMPPERVLLPVDLSELSAEVVARGLTVLDQLGVDRAAADLELFHAVAATEHEPIAMFRRRDVARRPGTEDLADFVARHRLESGFRLGRRCEAGPPRERFLLRIETFRPDLAILGTHGAAGFERFLLGSVAESVLKSARVSVLVLPPSALTCEIGLRTAATAA